MYALADSAAARPSFVVSAARTGSTVLRYLLDAHPEICCPPETNLIVAIRGVFNAVSVASGHPQDVSAWKPLAIVQSRAIADATLGAAAARSGKQRWCDKSLTNVDSVELITEVFPEADLIFLYRRCSDVVASGLEACPFGLSGYGFDQFAREVPLNLVHALVRYWLDRAERQLVDEARYPGRALRITYDELVLDTPSVLRRVCDFLEIAYAEEFFNDERVFNVAPSAGPEDHKINYTDRVHAESVGRGDALPFSNLVPAELLARVTEIEDQLGLARSTEARASLAVDAPANAARVKRLAVWLAGQFAQMGSRRLMHLYGDEGVLDLRVVIEGRDASAETFIYEGKVVPARPEAAVTLRVKAEILTALLDGLLTPADVARRTLIPAEGLGGAALPPTTAYAAVRTLLHAVIARSEGEQANGKEPALASAMQLGEDQ